MTVALLIERGAQNGSSFVGAEKLKGLRESIEVGDDLNEGAGSVEARKFRLIPGIVH